jgi:hypothetical protein
MKKPIESGGGNFQKTILRNSHSINNNNILYTYANLEDTTRPYGNLFKSFNFPITTQETNAYNSTYAGTALKELNKTKIVVAEIAKGSYGELIDGKTFVITVPVIVNGVPTGVTCYGTYFGYEGTQGTTYLNLPPNNTLNTQLSERNDYAKQFGIQPNSLNGFNSNVTFLFTNDLGSTYKPQIVAGSSTVITSSITLNSGSVNTSSNPYVLSGATFGTNDSIKVSVQRTDTNTSITGIKIKIGNNTFLIPNSSEFTPINEPGLSGENIKIYDEDTGAIAKNLSITVQQSSFNTSVSWSKYTNTNKFPSNTSTYSGKRYAIYNKVGGNLVSDRPVGILYQDKGIAVFTDSTIVNNFNYTAGTSSGFNGITSGLPYNSDTNFAKIYFTSSTVSSANYDSITTEFVQNIICVAGKNEFFGSTNSTYNGAYEQDASEKPVFITSIGLYNASGELIGIGKLSEPIKKLPETYIPFNIKLVI